MNPGHHAEDKMRRGIEAKDIEAQGIPVRSWHHE
jgi:hypothetical protein